MRRRRGFSLTELVITITILALVSAIAIPRLSRGTLGAADAALAKDLQSLRKAIDLYAAEHGGTYPSVADFKNQLRKYTDAAGNVSNKAVPPFVYGPYLAQIPKASAGPSKGSSKVAPAAGSGVAWVYVQATGEIRVNAADAETDALGRPYASY